MRKIAYIVIILAITTLCNNGELVAQLSISTGRAHIASLPLSDFEKSKFHETRSGYLLDLTYSYLQEYDKKSSYPIYLTASEKPFIQYNNLYRNYLSAFFDGEYKTKPPSSIGIVITINRFTAHEYLKLLDYAIKHERKFRENLKKFEKKDMEGIEEFKEEEIKQLTIGEEKIENILKKPNKRVEKFIKKYKIENKL